MPKQIKISYAYSLIELLFVLSIFLILVTISVPIKNFFNTFYLESEITRFCVFVRYLQMQAIASGQSYDLIFDQNKSLCTYKSSNSSINNKILSYKLENGIKFGFIPGSLGPPSRPNKIIKNAISLEKVTYFNKRYPNSCLTLFANGKIASGSIYFIDHNCKNMGALTCSPSSVSYLRKYKFYNKNWTILN